MLLTLTMTESPATDLGYLLYKHPDRLQSFDLTFGRAHVFYPEADLDRCTAALLLEVDTVGLTRRHQKSDAAGSPLSRYVNDRAYVASSFLSVAIAEIYGTALAGKCRDRPELATRPLPLEATLPVVPCRGGEPLLRRLFEPLGYDLTIEAVPAAGRFGGTDDPESAYYSLTLRADCRLSELLTHLYVLVPVLDDEKHYWVGSDEVEKLLRHGGGWLVAHPDRQLITRRYLRHRTSLVEDALSRLADEDLADPDAAAAEKAAEEEDAEARVGLNEQRIGAVIAALKASDARRVLDLGCGEGRLLKQLLADRQFTEVLGMDVSSRVLEIAERRLRLDRLPETQRERVRLIHGALNYRDTRLAGFDAAAVVEVIEHLEPHRLEAFERVLFEHARPGTVVLTTPNVEYNVRWPKLPAGRFRHRDHRFEWTRAEFESWTRAAGERFGYSARFLPVGPVDDEVGPPTQMAVMDRVDR